MSCLHPVKLRATNVNAAIAPQRHLTSGRDVVTLKYDEIVFCANPLCEQVFRTTREK